MLYLIIVFCALCWFSCQYLRNDWLERPLWGRLLVEEIISTKTTVFCVDLVYCLIVCLSIAYTISIIHPWHSIAYLCWKCHKTTISQPNVFVSVILVVVCCGWWPSLVAVGNYESVLHEDSIWQWHTPVTTVASSLSTLMLLVGLREGHQTCHKSCTSRSKRFFFGRETFGASEWVSRV